MLPGKLLHMHVFAMKLNSFIAMLIQFMCLDFLGQDNDVLWPDSVTQTYVVVVLWLTFIIALGCMCHFGF